MNFDIIQTQAVFTQTDKTIRITPPGEKNTEQKKTEENVQTKFDNDNLKLSCNKTPESTKLSVSFNDKEWSGDFVTKDDLKMKIFGSQEKEILKENNNQARVLPFESFDLNKEPVVLIHGFGPSSLVKDLAKDLDKKGKQVFIVYYDNTKTEPHESARQVAEQLSKIRQEYYPEGKSLDIVGHSMGGIVARGALNYLHDPKWLTEQNAPNYKKADIEGDKGGFGKINLRTVDTAIDGYYDLNTSMLFKSKILSKFLGFKDGPLSEMNSASPMFQSLYSVPLKDVDSKNITAYNNNGNEDWVLSLPELEPEDALKVVKAIADNKEPEHPQLKALVRGLRADSNYLKLYSAIKDSVDNGKLSLSTDSKGNVKDPEEFMDKLFNIYESTMPMVKGNHIMLLFDNPFNKNDCVDMLGRDLTTKLNPI